jgi:hypothetical protein
MPVGVLGMAFIEGMCGSANSLAANAVCVARDKCLMLADAPMCYQ